MSFDMHARVVYIYLGREKVSIYRVQGCPYRGVPLYCIYTQYISDLMYAGGVAGWVWSLVGSEQLLSHKLTAAASSEGESLTAGSLWLRTVYTPLRLCLFVLQ